jgi:hypothetical protein
MRLLDLRPEQPNCQNELLQYELLVLASSQNQRGSRTVRQSEGGDFSSQWVVAVLHKKVIQV